MAQYETVLHLIRYKNWHTEALFDRKFKLVCSELNGRYISNDFKVEVRPGSRTPPHLLIGAGSQRANHQGGGLTYI